MSNAVAVRVGAKFEPNPGDLPGHGAVYETVANSDDTVWLSRATMRRGTAASGKTWCRFKNESMDIFSWRRGNRMRFYRKSMTRNGGYIYDGTASVIRHALGGKQYGGGVNDRLVERVLEQRGKSSLSEMVLSEFPLAADIPVARGVTPLLALPNVQEFTRHFFGPSRYRKDLVRGVGKRGWMRDGGIDGLLKMKAYAPFVPVDWIAKALNDAPAPTLYSMRFAADMETVDVRMMRRMFRGATPKQVRRLFYDDATQYDFKDSMRTFAAINQIDAGFKLSELHFSNWKELHDLLPPTLRRLQTRNQEVKYTGTAAELIGVFDEYEIIGTPDTHTLMNWGAMMNNCIGGYGSSAVSGRSLLYAVLKDGKMLANMEIRPEGKIAQLVGKHNARLEVADEVKIRERVELVFPQPRIPGWERELLQAEPWHVNYAPAPAPVAADRALMQAF